jgi:hypothetical protein
MKVLFILTTVLLLTSCVNDKHESMLYDKINGIKHVVLSKQKIVDDSSIPATTTLFTVAKIHEVYTRGEDGEYHRYNDTVIHKYAVNDFGIDTIQ